MFMKKIVYFLCVVALFVATSCASSTSTEVKNDSTAVDTTVVDSVKVDSTVVK